MKYDTQHIDKYLNGELSQMEAKAFEQEMQSDKDFAYEVKLQQTAVETVEYANFMKKIEEIRSEEPISAEAQKPSSGIIRRLIPIILSAAAAVVLLLILIPVLFPPSNPAIAQKYHKDYTFNATQQSSGQQTLQQAQDTYNAKDYAVALPLLEKYISEESAKGAKSAHAAKIAKANAHYNLKQYDAAVVTLQPIASGNSTYAPTANWYLALTYLKQDKPEKAKAALRQIKSGKYYEDAQKMFKKIK